MALFGYTGMDVEDYKKSKYIFDDNERLLLYILLAYNTSEVLYNRGEMRLITNPGDITLNEVEISAFLDQFRSLVRTAIGEEDENGTDTNNTTYQKNIKNR
ncbi:MAG: hypothetical protein IJO52_00825 [Clostridia bacterium]|nr:hypothetical protein [Clostridia bacterium]